MLEPNTDHANGSAIENATAGALLRQARERKGLTQEAVAEQLNLLLSQVVALEENDFARFPGETFVRGHLRSYARLLNLDPKSVLKVYGGKTIESVRIGSSAPQIQWRPVSLEQKTSSWRRYSGLAATALVLAALWAWQEHRDKSKLLSLTADTGMAQELPGGIDSALNSGSENALLDSVQLLPNSDTKPQAPTADNGASNANSNVAASAIPTSADEIDKLSLRFSADCWIEIKDRDNKLIVATLKHADEKIQIEGRGPFKVLLGYAPGVSMAYNGTPVKVDVSEGSRSARLIVGNG